MLNVKEDFFPCNINRLNNIIVKKKNIFASFNDTNIYTYLSVKKKYISTRIVLIF